MKATYKGMHKEFVCKECGEKSTLYIAYRYSHDDNKYHLDNKDKIKCKHCNSAKVTLVAKPKKNTSAAVIIPAKHQACPSKDPVWGSIPRGEFPGDEDYDWMDEDDMNWGEAP